MDNQITRVREVIKKYCINQSVIARMMGMPESTFKLKLSETQTQYRFNTSSERDELKMLGETLAKIGHDILTASVPDEVVGSELDSEVMAIDE